jgi:hypothetical protein
MSIIRTIHNRENPYVQINKHALQDPNLSWKAKGLWAFCLSRPDDWEFHVSEIISNSMEGEKAAYSTINELIEKGYALRIQGREIKPDSKGGNRQLFSTVHYMFFEFKINKEEKEKYREEFKKCFPHLLFGDAEKEELLNTDCLQKKEKQQQQPPAACSAAASSHAKKEQQKPPPTKPPPKPPGPKPLPIYIYEGLKDVGIPDTDKIWISAHYDGPTIDRSIAWAIHPQTLIKKTLAAAIKWACEKNPEIPQTEGEKENANKQYALKTTKNLKIPSTQFVEVLNKYVEMGYGGIGQSTIIAYNEPNFKEKFHESLKKHKLE